MSPDKNGWIKISVAESLPEDDTMCFVWYDKNKYLGDEGWCYSHYCNDEFDVGNVTHWRPAFKPPIKTRK